MSAESRLLELWYGPAWRTAALWPLEALYRVCQALRSAAYRTGIVATVQAGAPVVIVGNLTVGGTGKTPIAAWLASALRAQDLAVAVVLRGYGGRHAGAPMQVTADSDPAEVGDEAILHARRGSLVFVGRDRAAAARAAVVAGAELVICDDGLQHLRLARQFEIAVVDAGRGLGNGHLLPAGPLRESRRRLASVDAIVLADREDAPEACLATFGRPVFRAVLRPGMAVNLRDGTQRPLAQFRDRTVHAVAAIGHPEAFFAALRSAGLAIEARAFPDHEAIREDTLAELGAATVLMTEKDAVKCRGLARPGWWYVDLQVSFQPSSAADELIAAVLAAAKASGPGGERIG